MQLQAAADARSDASRLADARRRPRRLAHPEALRHRPQERALETLNKDELDDLLAHVEPESRAAETIGTVRALP
jgi:hypothetical protein